VRELGERGDVGVVVDHDRATGGGDEPIAHGRLHEGGNVRRVVDHAVVIDHTGRAESERDRVGRGIRERVDHVRDGVDDVVDRRGRRRTALVDDRPLAVDHRRAQVRAAEVDPEGRGHCRVACRHVARG